jgi:enoyl-CoA hydratase/carnithine racemase
VGEFVRVETDPDHPAVAVIRLDRPKVNALNAALTAEIAEAATRVAKDPDVRAVVVYGGERVFVAGADIKEMADLTAARMLGYARDLQGALNLVSRIPKPVVAAVTGYALGGGLELALAADFRVAGAGARLGVPEIQLGVIPGAGGTQRLPRLIGPSRAKEMIFSGRHVKADEAREIGLVDQVVPDEEVYRAAVALVARYAEGPAVALAAAKEAVDRGLETDLDTGLEIERLHFAGLFSTEDQKDGMRSFVEQGPGKAVFKGR